MERLQSDKENSLEFQVINKESRLIYNSTKRFMDILLGFIY